jgi:DNA-binding transcriptional ArsR family regulator
VLEALITSKTRVKMLLKFFLNSNSEAYLRSLEQEFGESSNAIRVELNKFEEAGLLISKVKGNRKYFKANTQHPLFGDIHNIILKHVGIDRVVDTIVEKLGDLKKVYLVGDFSKGIDAQVIDLIFVGDNINRQYLLELVEKAEKMIERKIKYLVYGIREFENNKSVIRESSPLLLWSQDK